MLYLQYFTKCVYTGCPIKKYQPPTHSKAETPRQNPHNPRITSDAQTDPDPEIKTTQTKLEQSEQHQSKRSTGKSTVQTPPRSLECRSPDAEPKVMHPPNSHPTRTAPSPPKPLPGQRKPEIQQNVPTLLLIKRQHPLQGHPPPAPVDYSTFKCRKSCATSWPLICIESNLI